jgi:hypothetical protein
MNYIRKNIIFVILCTICFTSCDNWSSHPPKSFVIDADALFVDGILANSGQQLYNFNAKGKAWTIDQSNNNSLVDYDTKVDYYRNWDRSNPSSSLPANTIRMNMNEPAPDAKWALTFELRCVDCFIIAPLSTTHYVKPTYLFKKTYDSYESDVYVCCENYNLEEAEPCD